jgi:hypothetical protein
MVDTLELGAGGPYADTYHVSGRRTGGQKPQVLYTMLQSERAHLVRVPEVPARAGVEAHRIALEEKCHGARWPGVTGLQFLKTLRRVVSRSRDLRGIYEGNSVVHLLAKAHAGLERAAVVTSPATAGGPRPG